MRKDTIGARYYLNAFGEADADTRSTTFSTSCSDTYSGLVSLMKWSSYQCSNNLPLDYADISSRRVQHPVHQIQELRCSSGRLECHVRMAVCYEPRCLSGTFRSHHDVETGCVIDPA